MGARTSGVVTRDCPHCRLIRLSTLYTSAVSSSDWPDTVGKTFVSRALRVANHGLRQLLRSAIRPRCRRKHGSLSMKRFSVPQSAGAARAMSDEIGRAHV